MTTVEAYQEPSSVEATVKVRAHDGKSYSYWRLRILYGCIVGYATFYLVRQNFAMAIPSIGAEFGYTKAELGLIMSAFAVVYGVGKFINGYISDRSNARQFMTIGLLISAGINIAMGYSSWIFMLGALWAINGWFQSMGWPPSARMLTHWFSPRELGTKWSIWSSSHQIGSASITVLAGFLIEHYGWRSAFFVPGILAACIALFLFNRVRDNPHDLGFPPVEEYKGDVTHELCESNEKLSFKEAWGLVFKNKLVWYISIANLFLYIPRMGVLNWAPTFLKEFKGVSLVVAGGQVAGFDIAGLVGGMAAGWLSDKYFGGRRGPVATTYLLFLALSVLVLWQVPAGHPFIDAISLMFAGFLVSGPQVLSGIALADFASKRAVGLATGLQGFLAYVVGSAISGAGVGKIVDVWGWGGGFILFIFSTLIAAFFFALTWKHRARVLEQGEAALAASTD
jgi:phosphoglycerate transporter family protein